jgi:hypothetical protein
MSVDDDSTTQTARVRILRLDALAQGFTTGVVTGLALFVATNVLVLKGGDPLGPHLSLLGQYFPGYTVSFVGSLIGLAWGFAAGFAAGYLVSRIYNAVVARRVSAGSP